MVAMSTMRMKMITATARDLNPNTGIIATKPTIKHDRVVDRLEIAVDQRPHLLLLILYILVTICMFKNQLVLERVTHKLIY